MRRLALVVGLVATTATAQDAPEAKSILLVRSPTARPASVSRVPADTSLSARRWRTVTTFLGSTAGALVVGVAGAWVGFELARDCYDVCLPPEMLTGWAVGSAVGAGLGAHLGGGRSGSLPWALAASGGVQIGLWLYSTDGRPFAVLVPVSVLAATIADRVSASGRVD